MNEVKVLAAAPCGKTPVCDSFYDCFYNLVLPEGSIRQRAKGGSVALNLNLIVEEARKYECTHLFIVEDDSMFHPMTVMNLLSHDKDVVAGLCPNRNSPFMPYVYGDSDEEGLQYYLLKKQDQGLIRVLGTGMGGILIKMHVFDKLEKPYFAVNYRGEKEWGQDIYFQQKMINAGIEMYCDTNVPIWHATHCALATMFEDGQWWTKIKIGEAVLRCPAPVYEHN